jgi:DNA repair exonuclease SbcCD ATPase subunit
MQAVILSNRFLLGIVAFSVSFGLSLVPNWDFSRAFITGIITVLATYAAAFFVDKRRRHYEMLVLVTLRKRIKEQEALKTRIYQEIKQIEEHRSLLYAESQQLQNQIADSRNQRDSLHRELGNSAVQKKQLETEANNLKNTIQTLEKNNTELSNACSNLTAEKRRLELNSNVSRAEIAQLQTQIETLRQEKEEIENSLTLLGRLKPQLEEKMYELRIEIQELEIVVNQQNQILATTKTERANIATNLNTINQQITEKQLELQQLNGQVSILQGERDLLQSQVWELLQQTETLNVENIAEIQTEDDVELFPFADLIAPLDEPNENLPEEWTNFLEKLPGHEIEVLKAIIQEDNPKAVIKQIAEANITMPNLLIDSINERANDIIGELIIEPGEDTPEVYQEHLGNVRKMLAMYEDLMGRQASSN